MGKRGVPPVQTTAGAQFDPKEGSIYFLASSLEHLRQASAVHDAVLCTILDLHNDADLEKVQNILDHGTKVFVDSGVFTLAVQHAKAHGLSMDQALSLPPTDIDGFEALYAHYLDLLSALGDRVWGYVEIDLGGREQKIKTRAKLEAAGLRPIPVYHPLVDGWDYFDYLAQRYDRICFGNIVFAPRQVRLRLLATLWERHCQYPNLWVHILGLTPNEFMTAYPSNSGDSSSWLSVVRWSGYKEKALNRTVSAMDHEWQYVLGEKMSTGSYNRSLQMSAYGSAMNQHSFHAYLETLKEEGAVIYAKQ